jgi:hypothetical protein
MHRQKLVVALLVLGSTVDSYADTLFLRSGRQLKIRSLMCDRDTCTAAIDGGEVGLRAGEVLRVEADEIVDPEPQVGPSSAPGPVATTGVTSRSIEELIADAARKYALPISLVRAVAQAESAMNTRAVSHKGASGVMQLMPGTAKDLGVRDVFDAAENIEAGVRLLRQHLEKYDGRVAEALAAYNAGPGAVARHGGVPPYRETRGYIRKIVRDYEKAEEKSGSGERRGK